MSIAVRLFGVLLAASLSACTAIRPSQPPLLSPFGDGTQWVVWEDLDFQVELNDKSKTTIRVPRGFVTDLASTPPEVWSFYPPFGRYLSASILHDYLYWRQTCKREEADKIFAQTMKDAGVPQQDQSRFYVVLRKAGEKAWSNNATEVKQGLVRVLPPEFLDLSSGKRSPNDSWKDVRAGLLKEGIKERPQLSDSSIPLACNALGQEIRVNTGLRSLIFGN